MAQRMISDNHVRTFKTRKGADNYADLLNSGSECQWWKGQRTEYVVWEAGPKEFQVRATTYQQEA